MTLPLYVIQLLKNKSGSDLRLPSDCELLSLDIESRTSVHIGATTLKRLLGFASDERTPHASTLDAIARYLDFAHWEELSRVADKGNSGFNTLSDELRAVDLLADDVVEITYLPDRLVVLRYLGDGHFVVEESQNSKLLLGDEAEILHFVLHHPLLITNVWRNDTSLGALTLGRISGLQSVRKIKTT